MQGIFISYRRQDSQSAAGRLADHLKEHLREVPIFRDVETIEPGVDFVDAIDRALRSCGVLLAVIGPRWLTVTDAGGRRRLDDANDYTRLEVAAALGRSDVRVIPVLVDGAQMPVTDDLPDDLKPLSRRNAIELTDKRWEYDVSQLVDTLRKALGLDPEPGPTPRPMPRPPEPPALPWYRRLTRLQWVGVGFVVLVLAGLAAEQEQAALDVPVLPPEALLQAPVAPPAGYRNGLPPTAAVQTAPGLTGAWHDAEGGRYRVVDENGTLLFDGMSPHGPVQGAGEVSGRQVVLNYTLGGVAYVAELVLSDDGQWLRGRYANPMTGESGMVSMQRGS